MLSPDSRFYQGMVRLSDLVIINLFIWLTSVGVVTVGASLAAGYWVLFAMVRQEDHRPGRAYWREFRRLFWPATLGWLAFLALMSLLGWEFYVSGHLASAGALLLVRSILVLVALLLVGMGTWYFPSLSFYTVGFLRQARAALLLALRYPHWTALALAEFIGPFVLVYYLPTAFGAVLTFYLLCGLALSLYLLALGLSRPLSGL